MTIQHLFTDELELQELLDFRELHEVTKLLGRRRSLFWANRLLHHNLTMLWRQEAIAYGAITVTSRDTAEIWKRPQATAQRLQQGCPGASTGERLTGYWVRRGCCAKAAG